MKKLNWIAWVLLFALLLCGCSKTQEDVMKLEDLFYRTEVAMEEGQLFFAGKVLSVQKQDRAITYYESETVANTFYEVEVTEDFFGFLPERTLTVCVMGTGEHFVSRTEPEKGKEYLFQVKAWAGEEEMLFLLPTFYEALPQRESEYIYYTKGNQRYAVDGGYEDYKQRLLDLAEQYGYSAQGVGKAILADLQAAGKKDAAYFEELEFKTIDRAAIDGIAAFAAERGSIAAPKTAQEIKEILK
ncbi:MAG: hypothetical protein IJ995_03450 [Clostridia bacterium]|nr:hypothetical protein [Clostridia bacterium]